MLFNLTPYQLPQIGVLARLPSWKLIQIIRACCSRSCLRGLFLMKRFDVLSRRTSGFRSAHSVEAFSGGRCRAILFMLQRPGQGWGCCDRRGGHQTASWGLDSGKPPSIVNRNVKPIAAFYLM